MRYSSPRLEVPAWVDPLLKRSAGHLQLLSTTIHDVGALTASDLSDAVANAYRELGRRLDAQHCFPVRIWNFVPDIQGALGDGDRYMAFNAGRYAAYAEWYGAPDHMTSAVPTASAVGVDGDALSIHVLAADAPGTPVENPRQIPAYRYSRRYGRRPPCFARATKFRGTLLIGGTASIVGEESIHVDDIATQTRETFHNLDALIGSANGQSHAGGLRHIIDLRVHVAHAEDAAAVSAILDEVVPSCRDVEFVEAKLCRRELLVEIEGRAACG